MVLYFYWWRVKLNILQHFFMILWFFFSLTSPHQTTNFLLRNAATYVTWPQNQNNCYQKTFTWKMFIWDTSSLRTTAAPNHVSNHRDTLTCYERPEEEENWEYKMTMTVTSLEYHLTCPWWVCHDTKTAGQLKIDCGYFILYNRVLQATHLCHTFTYLTRELFSSLRDRWKHFRAQRLGRKAARRMKRRPRGWLHHLQNSDMCTKTNPENSLLSLSTGLENFTSKLKSCDVTVQSNPLQYHFRVQISLQHLKRNGILTSN